MLYSDVRAVLARSIDVVSVSAGMSISAAIVLITLHGDFRSIQRSFCFRNVVGVESYKSLRFQPGMQ